MSAEARTITVRPGQSIRDAVARASSGDRIDVLPGTYMEGAAGDLNALTVTRDDIELVGLSSPHHPVVLANAGAQGYGVWVSPPNSAGPIPEAQDEQPPCASDGSMIHRFTIRGFTVQGFSQHGVHLACVDGFVIDSNVAENNQVYGLFPIASRHGAMRDNIVRGSVEDAGIYIGQSDDVVITGNRSEDNLIGLEVENSTHCTVAGNDLGRNSVGLFVDVLFGKVKLIQQTTLVTLNNVHDNNRPNTADPSDLTSAIPAGIGILLLGADTTTVTSNEVSGNGFAGIAVASLCLVFTLQGQACPDLDVDPNPDGNRITNNHVEGNGTASTGNPLLDSLRADLVWDGSGTENCWDENRFFTSVPPALPPCPRQHATN